MVFDKEAYKQFVLDNDIVSFSRDLSQAFKLASGRTTHLYMNWRLNDVFAINSLRDFLIDYIKDKQLIADCIYGVPEGASRLAILAQNKLASQSENFGPGSHTLPMGRGVRKDYGDPKDIYFIGEPKGRTIVLEDVTTTGGSVIKKGITLLEKLGNVEIEGIISLTNRDNIKNRMETRFREEFGINYFPLIHVTEILQEASKKHNPNEDVKRSVEEEFKDYGIKLS